MIPIFFIRVKATPELPMFYKASREIMIRARQLRKRLTEPEKLLWAKLRAGKLNGLKFRRQHPIFNYIADFYCHSEKIIIEIDGPLHELEWQEEYDVKRDKIIGSLGIKILRFKNEEVLTDIDLVTKKILDFINH
jgi:very-short-patch-repair endonuclease